MNEFTLTMSRTLALSSRRDFLFLRTILCEIPFALQRREFHSRTISVHNERFCPSMLLGHSIPPERLYRRVVGRDGGSEDVARQDTGQSSDKRSSPVPDVCGGAAGGRLHPVPLQHRRGLNSALVLHVLRLQHALVVAQQPGRREDRLVAEAGRFQEMIVTAAAGLAVAAAAVAVAGGHVVVVFGDVALALARIIERGMTQPLGAVAFGPIGIVRQVALVQVELFEVLPDIEVLKRRNVLSKLGGECRFLL